MSREDRAQPLGNDVILEYIVHGAFFWKESDVNVVYGAWWVPLRTMVKQLGAEYVTEKIDDFEMEMKKMRAVAIERAVEDGSSGDEGGG